MPRKKKTEKPYRIIGAYDSETTNIAGNGRKFAFPILHQLGIIDEPIETVTPGNVEDICGIQLYRHTIELYAALDDIVAGASTMPYVPVIACHNLAFDMYGLAPWLANYPVRVLAKSQRKPISFAVQDPENGEPLLVIWDTLVFTQKSLAYLGDACGYKKLSGDWDYDKIRTPDTPLTDAEIAYAEHDIYALLAYLGYWCRLNPDISPDLLGRRVVTKTGVVRMRREQRFYNLKGAGMKRTVGYYWTMLNQLHKPKTNDELFTNIACTRGGFTFCAARNASRVFDYSENDPYRIVGYDATSQHPAQIVSHMYPVEFHEATPTELYYAFSTISKVTLSRVLNKWHKPFPVAFDACFEFENLRLKEDTVFSQCGIAPLASARCDEYKIDAAIAEDSQASEEFKEFIASQGYKDIVDEPTYEFGKLVSARRAVLFITELTAWEISQLYDYDSVRAISGYLTSKFRKPSDMTVLAVMNFYAAKNEMKHAIAQWKRGEHLDNAQKLLDLGIPQFVVDGMDDGTIAEPVVNATYLGTKADLNALFGIECTNPAQRDTILGSGGIEYVGDFGIENLPKIPRVFYQCGQRIVGWSRIAQIVVLMLIAPHIVTVVNGDTDSVKVVATVDGIACIDETLQTYGRALDRAKFRVTARIRNAFPEYYDELEAIGYYVKEFETCKYCASWNKAYAIYENDKVKFTLAGIPAGRGANQLANRYMTDGHTFGEVCDIFLGYNVTYSHSLIKLNARSFPEWGNMVMETVTDYLGNASRVIEPAALCLYPMAKIVNDCGNRENAANYAIAKINRPTVNHEPVILTKDEIVRMV